MNILQLCKKFPFPAKDGESVAVLSMSKGISACGVQISLLAMNTSKHFVDIDHKSDALEHYSDIQSVFVKNDIDPFDAFINLFSNKSYNIQRFVSPQFETQLTKLLQSNNYDILQLESLYMVPYIKVIRKYSKAKIILRSHNLEYEIWKNLSDKTNNPFLKWYYNLCSRRLKTFEFKHIGEVDSVVFISSEDALKYKSLGFEGKYLVSPVGFDPRKYKSERSDDPSIKKLGYIGSLDWKPNIEGVSWFIDEVWPLLNQKFPDLEFHLAGRNASQALKSKLPKSISFHGEIENALSFIDDLDVLVVPLFSGSGIRVKILESMALSKVVLSTSKGFEGIGIEHGKQAFQFGSVEDIINSINIGLHNPDEIARMKINARKHIEHSFDYLKLSEELISHYSQLI